MAAEDGPDGDPGLSDGSPSPDVRRQNGTTTTNTKLNHFKKESKKMIHPAPRKTGGGGFATAKVVLLDGEEFECQLDVSIAILNRTLHAYCVVNRLRYSFICGREKENTLIDCEFSDVIDFFIRESC